MSIAPEEIPKNLNNIAYKAVTATGFVSFAKGNKFSISKAERQK